MLGSLEPCGKVGLRALADEGVDVTEAGRYREILSGEGSAPRDKILRSPEMERRLRERL